MIISYHLMIMLLSSRSAANGTIPKPCQHVLTCTATSLQTGVLHAGTNFKSTEPLPHSSFPKTSPPGGSIELCNLRKCVLAGGPTANCKQTNKQTNRDSESLSQSHVQPKKQRLDSMQLWPFALVLYPTSLRSNKAWHQDLDWQIIINMSESLGRSDTSGHIVRRPNLYMRYLPPETHLKAVSKDQAH